MADELRVRIAEVLDRIPMPAAARAEAFLQLCPVVEQAIREERELHDLAYWCEQYKLAKLALAEKDASIQAQHRLITRAWGAVRADLEPDAYRDGKFDLDHAIAHRLAEKDAQIAALQAKYQAVIQEVETPLPPDGADYE